MSFLRLTLVAVLSSITTLVVAAGCDIVRTSLSTQATPTVVEAPAGPPTAPPTPSQTSGQGTSQPADQPAGQAATRTAGPIEQSPSPSASQPPVARTDSAPGNVAAVPAAPVAQAAPGDQAGNPYDTVIQVYRNSRPSVVTVISSVVQPGFRSDPQPAGTGSGFMIDERGYILTNNHVVEEANKLEIALANGTTLPAELVGRDARFDLAVIKANIPQDQLRVMTLGDSDLVQVGEQAIAIGNPYGLEGTVTSGIVSSRRPVVSEPGGGDGVLVNAIQTDTSINPGNSGGPLLNARGEVIGVNTLGLMPNGGQTGLNFAIPINNARRILPDLLNSGSYAHPFVGIGSAEITPQIASTLSLPVQEGLLVQTVEPTSGAARAGLRGGSQPREVGSRQVAAGGDIIVTIDNQRVRRPEDFIAYLELNKKAGETVTLTIIRDGQQRDVQVTLGARPLASSRPSR
jgi:S1-C subfamily serine protease